MNEKEYLKQHFEKLNNEIRSLQLFIDSCPEGQLISRRNNDGTFRYAVRKKDGSKTKEQYLNRKDRTLAEMFAKKEYAIACLKDKVSERWLTEQELAFKEKEKHSDHLLKKRPGIAALVLPTLKNHDDYVMRWQQADYKKSTLHPENLKFSTVVPGLMVRSKSESLIVALLVKYGIPFRYEEELVINGVTLHPDFTCMNPRTHEIFYLEHQGKWDDPGYVKEVRRRENHYLNAGIYPWKNLLFTTETADQPLDVQWLETIIKYYLL